MRPRYRKVSTQIWADEKIRSLDDDGKFAFVFLLTHPHLTAIGAMRATLHGLAAELGWPIRRFTRAVRQLTNVGMVLMEERVGLIWLPNFLKHNEPEGPNSVAKAWVHGLRELPECDLRRRVAQVALTYLQGRSEAFLQALPPDVLKEFEKGAEGMPSRMPSGDAMSDPSPMPSQHPGAGTGAGTDREASRSPDQTPSPRVPPGGEHVRPDGRTTLSSQPPEPGKEPGPPPNVTGRRVGAPPTRPPGSPTPPSPSQEGLVGKKGDRPPPLGLGWVPPLSEKAHTRTAGRSPYTKKQLSHIEAILPAVVPGTPDGASEGGRVPQGQAPPPGSGSDGSDVGAPREGRQVSELADQVEALLRDVVGPGRIRLVDETTEEERREAHRQLEVLVDYFERLPAPPTEHVVGILVKKHYPERLIRVALDQVRRRGRWAGDGHPGGHPDGTQAVR